MSFDVKHGDHVRVKRTPILRKYGIRTGGRWAAKHDTHAWPGEVAAVEVRTRDVVEDGGVSQEMSVWLVFSRGREIPLSSADADDFIKLPKRLCPWCKQRVSVNDGANVEHPGADGKTKCDGSGGAPVPPGRE